MTELFRNRSHFRLYADPDNWKGWTKIFLMEDETVFPKRCPIIEQGEHTDSLFYIVSGIVEYTHTNGEGVETLLDAMGEGNVIGLQPFFNKVAAIASFIAMTDVVAVSLEREKIYAHIEKDSSLALEITVELCRILEGLVGHHISSNTANVKGKMIDFICALCETDKSEKRSDGRIFIRLSQEELARVTRASRVSIAMALRDLKKENLLDTAYGGIFINDYNGLKASI